jgi:hypothetical protein
MPIRGGSCTEIFPRFPSKIVCKFSGHASYDRLDLRTTWVTTKLFVLTYDQVLSYDPRQRQRGEHISDIT